MQPPAESVPASVRVHAARLVYDDQIRHPLESAELRTRELGLMTNPALQKPQMDFRNASGMVSRNPPIEQCPASAGHSCPMATILKARARAERRDLAEARISHRQKARLPFLRQPGWSGF
jgi:hypothetical protein